MLAAHRVNGDTRMASSNHSNRSSVVVCTVFVMLLSGLGCSGSAQVSGKVTFDSQPVAGAQVVFVAEDKGEYRLIPNTPAGIAVGKYKVAVTKEALKDGTVPQGEGLEEARTNGLLSNILPKVYEDRATTPLVFDIC